MYARSEGESVPIEVRIQNKRKELENLTTVGNLTTIINEQLMELSDQLTNMTQEAESIVSVSENWNNILRSIALATSTLRNYKRVDYDNGVVLPEPLIRLKIDKDTKRVVEPDEESIKQSENEDEE